MSKVNDLIPKGYFDTHKVVDGTAAGVLVDMAVSDLILFPEEKMPDLELSSEEAALAEEVRTCTDAEQLVRWMRKPVSGLLRSRILRRALAFEKDVLPLMEHRALTTQLDAFEDCVTMFFLVCKKNPCPWIMEHYDEVRSEFLQSQFCLILGMRGSPNYIPFLLEQVDRFEKLRTKEQYLEQGPLLGINALQGWPDEREDWNVYDAPAFFDLPLTVDLPEELSEEEMREQTKEGTELFEKVKAEAAEYLKQRMEQILAWYEGGQPLERIAVEVGLPEEVVASMIRVQQNEKNGAAESETADETEPDAE